MEGQHIQIVLITDVAPTLKKIKSLRKQAQRLMVKWEISVFSIFQCKGCTFVLDDINKFKNTIFKKIYNVAHMTGSKSGKW